MTKLKNFLRCYAMGMGIKSISNTFQISRNTVRKYVRRYQGSIPNNFLATIPDYKQAYRAISMFKNLF